jgi:hypothetical protein
MSYSSSSNNVPFFAAGFFYFFSTGKLSSSPSSKSTPFFTAFLAGLGIEGSFDGASFEGSLGTNPPPSGGFFCF